MTNFVVSLPLGSRTDVLWRYVVPALASATEEIGPLVTDAVRDAQEKAAALAAHEFGRAAEDFNLPIPAESLRGLLGGAS